MRRMKEFRQKIDGFHIDDKFIRDGQYWIDFTDAKMWKYQNCMLSISVSPTMKHLPLSIICNAVTGWSHNIAGVSTSTHSVGLPGFVIWVPNPAVSCPDPIVSNGGGNNCYLDWDDATQITSLTIYRTDNLTIVTPYHEE